VLPESVHELVQHLTQTIYRHGDERSKARAAICTTYARCIADDFYTARDMLLMSHLQARPAHLSACDGPTGQEYASQ
jgi:translation initiation factor 3 subunit C